MTFAQAGVPMPVNPHAKQQPVYVLAPQTDTPQGETPGFPHDHVIQVAPTQNQGASSVLMHGYFVVCSPEGISTGNCVFAMETIPGDGQIPLAKTVNGSRAHVGRRHRSGRRLRSARSARYGGRVHRDG